MIQSKALDFSLHRRVPVILQSEVTECGLTCIVMIGCFFGHQWDVHTLRKRFSVSLKGLTLKHLMKVADQCGFVSRAIRCDIDDLRMLK